MLNQLNPIAEGATSQTNRYVKVRRSFIESRKKRFRPRGDRVDRFFPNRLRLADRLDGRAAVVVSANLAMVDRRTFSVQISRVFLG